jgi:type IV pilus assembly protein PilP
MRLNDRAAGSSFLAVLLLAISGCSEDTSDLERWIAETKLKYQGQVEPLPEIAPYRTFVYDASILSDPFVIEQYVDDSPTGPKPDAGRRKGALEYFPLDTLKMVGTLEQNNIMWGLIRDSDGTIHRVQAGNYAGENDGKILTVSETEISISELIPDGLGGWIDRQASLSLGYE